MKAKDLEIQKLLFVLKRTHDSLCTHSGNGNNPNTQRGYILRDRYDTTKRELKLISYDAWLDYCKELRYSKEHSGIDFYA